MAKAKAMTIKMGGLRFRRTREGTLVDQYRREYKQVKVEENKWELKYTGIRKGR